jgi:branched-chain amino acid transport system permease protein
MRPAREAAVGERIGEGMPVESQEALEAVVGATFHARMRAWLPELLTAEVIAEHRRTPLGQHSEPLQRILNYLGALPIDGKLITEHDGADHWFVSRLVGFPAVRADRILGPFDTEGEAMDAVFRQRLADVFGLRLDD